MPTENPKDLKKHFDSLKANRSTWESLWQEVCDYGIARRTFTSQTQPQGEGKRTKEIYDNTMMVANDLLASGLHNLLTSTAIRWFALEPDDKALLEIPGIAEWFSEIEEIMYRSITAPEAGFHPQIAEVYNDIAAFGNGSMSVMRVPGKGLAFQAMPLSEIFVDEDSYGRINQIYRFVSFTALQIKTRFGDGVVKAADKAIERGDYLKPIQLLQCLLPNEVYSKDKKFGPGASQILSIIIEYESPKEIERKYFREMPIAFARWNKDPGEIYARGPGIQALSDQRMLNSMNKTTLKAAQKAVDPPILVPDNGFITQLDIGPGGMSVYRGGTTDAIRELYTRAGENPELGVQAIQQRQTNVRAAYHFELLQLIQDPRMSATQVMEISSRTQQILSPIVGRIQSELLEPLMERVFNICLRMKKFPPIPDILAGRDISIRYISPVQRAQRSGEAQALLNALNSTLQLGQIDPNILDTIDNDKIARFFFDAWGVPANLLKTEEEVAAIRNIKARKAQMQEQIDQGTQIAQGAGHVLPSLAKMAGPGGMEALNAVNAGQQTGEGTPPAA